MRSYTSAGVHHLVAEWEKECEGVDEVSRRAWAEDAASQGFLVSHALPGLSTHQLIISCPGRQWEEGTNSLSIIVTRGSA